MKIIVTELTTRQKQVENRLAALKIEETQLETELQMIHGLINYYNKMDYDVITEERKGTEVLLKKRPDPLETLHKEKRTSPRTMTGQSKYDEPLKIIFQENKPLTLTDIQHQLGILDIHIDYGSLWNILKRAVKLNKITKPTPKTYLWKKDDNA